MFETSDWIAKIIESCIFPFQLDCCHVLLFQFKAKFDTEIQFKEEYDKLQGLIDKMDTFMLLK